MLHERHTSVVKPQLPRLLRMAIAPTALVLAALLIPPWVSAMVPERNIRWVAQQFLLVAEPAYEATFITAATGMVVLAWRVIRARRRRESPAWAARLLLLCVSVLVATFMAEGVAAAWRARAHPYLPIANWPQRRDDDDRDGDGDPDKSEVNIVVIGGSSAFGLPFEKWLSTGHIVAWKLGEAIPERRFRLDVLAEPGVHLERMHTKLFTYRCRPDLLIIYAGHNEFTYRFRWSRSVDRYFDQRPFRPFQVFEQFARRYSPLCALIQDAVESNGLAEPPPSDITRQLVDVPAYTPEEYTALLADFRRRLEAIVTRCEQAGTQVVLLIPPGNDSGFEPNRSLLPRRTSRAERKEFTRRFLAIRASEADDPARAAKDYRSLLADYPRFAEAHYRIGRLLARVGKRGEARRHARLARDLDGLPMRCPGDFQQVYREVATGHPQALLVDGQAVMAAASKKGVGDDWLFLDAMHPTVRGHAILAQAVLAGLKARGAFGWPAETPAPELSLAECADHFGVNAETWKTACEWGVSFYKQTAYIRHDPSRRLKWIERYRKGAQSIAQGNDPEDLGLPGIGIRPPALHESQREASIETSEPVD